LNLKDKLPSLNKLAPVFGVISLFVYSWTLLWFFWKLNGWLVYLNLEEIGVILIYALATNLLESLVVLGVPVLIGILLPARLYMDQFIARSTAWLLPGLSYLVFAAFQFEGRSKFHQSLIVQAGIPVVFFMAIFIYATVKWQTARKLFEGIADRSTIFIYFFLPISVISLVIVIVRNIL
jgi:hypothetical protein